MFFLTFAKWLAEYPRHWQDICHNEFAPAAKRGVLNPPLGGDPQEEVRMKKSTFLGTLAVTTVLAGAAFGGTLDDVKARGELLCGTNPGLTGFAAPDANGEYQGFDAALCKAIAAAVLGDASKVKFVPLSSEVRFTALASGEVDVLIRNSTATYSRDSDLKLDFPVINYYDGQGFMVKKDLGVSSAKELDGATV